MAETPSRYFTIEEANNALPYVRRIVEDIVTEYDQWRDCIYRYEVLATTSKSEEGETEEQVELREEVDQIAQRINKLIDELSKVGCVFKGFEGGLVDFYGRLNGREICLCWKLGEPDVGHWHEVDDGFKGRKPLAPEVVKEVSA